MNLRLRLSPLLRGSQTATLEERNARNLVLSGGWLGFIDGGILTYLPVWLARMGATPTTMSLLSSGPQLINMIALLPAGAFVERQTDLVKLANRSAILARSSYLLIAILPFLLNSPDITGVTIVIWSLFAVLSSIQLPTLMSVIQLAVPLQLRARVNANRWAVYSVVGALAIPAFGLLIDHTPFPWGYQTAFVLSFVCSIPNLYFFGKVIIPPFKGHRPQASANLPLAVRLRTFIHPFLESKRFVRYNLATAGFRLSLAMPAGLFSLFWVDYLHANNTWIGIRGSIGYVALVFGYSFWGRMTNRIGHRWLLFLSALIGLYPIMTALSPTVEWLLPAAVLWGIFVAAIDIGVVDMLLAACPEGRQPSFTALANVLSSIELFIGPLIGAAIAQVVGVPMALIVTGVLQIASCVFFVLLPSREEERRDHAAAIAKIA